MKQRGFTLIELVLTMTLLGILAFPVVYLLDQGTRGYTSMFSNVETSQDARAGLQKIKDELILLTSAKITQATASQISFTDSTGAATNYRLQGTNLMRGNDLLMDHVQSITFTYKDQNNVTTANIASIRRIGIDLRVMREGSNTPLVYQMEIFPRNFMYQAYQ